MSNSNQLNNLSIMTAAIQIVSSIYMKENGNNVSEKNLAHSIGNILLRLDSLREIILKELQTKKGQEISIEAYNTVSKIALQQACIEKQNEALSGYLILTDSSFKDLLYIIKENNKVNSISEQLIKTRSDDYNTFLILMNLKLYTHIYFYCITNYPIQSKDLNLIQDLILNQTKDIFTELCEQLIEVKNENLFSEYILALGNLYLICVHEAFIQNKEINTETSFDSIELSLDDESISDFAEKITAAKQGICWEEFFDNIYENFQLKKGSFFSYVTKLANKIKQASDDKN
jgi:hypothetical protein